MKVEAPDDLPNVFTCVGFLNFFVVLEAAAEESGGETRSHLAYACVSKITTICCL